MVQVEAGLMAPYAGAGEMLLQAEARVGGTAPWAGAEAMEPWSLGRTLPEAAAQAHRHLWAEQRRAVERRTAWRASLASARSVGLRTSV